MCKKIVVEEKYNLQYRLNALREELGISEKQMLRETKTYYETIKNIGKFGDKAVGFVPLYLLNCDESYQITQLVNPTIVDQIVASYDARKFEPVKVILRNYEGGEPGFWLPDGRHRTLAALDRGQTNIFADVFEVTSREDEINLFLDQYTDRNKLKPYAKYNALLLKGDPHAKIIEQSCREHGLEIAANRTYTKKGTINGIATLLEIAPRIGKQGLDFIFDVLKDSYMNTETRAYSDIMLRSLSYIYRIEGADCYGYVVDVLKGKSVELIKTLAKMSYRDKPMGQAVSTYLIAGIEERRQKMIEEMYAADKAARKKGA